MKINDANLYYGILILLVFEFLTIGNLHAQYCTPSNIGTFNNNYISNVSFGSINNKSTGSTGKYTYYSSLPATEVQAGKTIEGTVSVTLNGWNTEKNTVVVWVNFNDESDDDFEDKGEEFLFSFHGKNDEKGNKTIEVPFSIEIPSTIKSGLSRIRIGYRTGNKKKFTSCDYDYEAGEIEDYNIKFISENNPDPVDEEEEEPKYCEPKNIGTFNTNYISNVALGDINNISSGSTGDYTYYSSLAATKIPVGETINGIVTVTLDGWNKNENMVIVWMNFNESSDDDFEDKGEQFIFTFQDKNSKSGNKTVDVPISIPVPSDILSGNSVIRIGFRTGDKEKLESCDFNYQAGEIEDYKISYTTKDDDNTTEDPEVYDVDSDGDGIKDSVDLDDDNDGILDEVELRCSQSSIANTTSGSGAYQDQLYIFNWTDPSFSDGLHNGDSQTFKLENGLTIVATVSGINSKDASSASSYFPNDMNTWSGAFAHRQYNTDGSAEAFYGSYASDMTFKMTFLAKNCGKSQRLDILAIDAEATSGGKEFIKFTTNGNNWAAVDAYGGGGKWTGAGTKTIQITDTEGSGGNTVFYSENSSVITTQIDAGGKQGVAFGIWLICDTDNDCIANYLDLDSDADGCPDAFEGGGDFTGSQLVSDLSMAGGSTDVFGNLGLGADTNKNGLLDIADPKGQSVGNSQNAKLNECPEVVDFDGIDDVLKVPNKFSLNKWSQLTLQFWVKSNALSQINAGVLGQKGVLEITQNGSLTCEIFGQGKEGMFTNKTWLSNSDAWQHITLVYNQGKMQFYYNGKLEYEATSSTSKYLSISDNTFNIGGLIKTGDNSNFFNGWIDEVRVFNVALTESQIQQIIYQEIDNNNGNVKGTVIQKDVEDIATGNRLNWKNLQLYYKMGDKFSDRKTIDYSQNNLHASLHNIYTKQSETAPMLYVTKKDGDLNDRSIWLHSDVWNSTTDSKLPVESTIIQISHNVTLNQDIENVGLIIDSGKTLTIGTDGSDYQLKNSWYLELNGTLDLAGDSQLIQTTTSDLVTSATGKLLRRQEGTTNAFRYNYWSSPVGTLGATSLSDNNAATNNANNTSFKLNMIKDEVGINIPFTTAYNQVGKISTYWLYTFKNGRTYWDWAALPPTTSMGVGVGYTQKGTGNAGTEQQYIFEGKPNNGTILVNVTDVGGPGSVTSVSKTEFLFGNPYPSAIDIHKFIDDNAGMIEGSLQLWQHWGGNTHTLNEYEGGYAQVNKTGSVRAFQFVGLEGANNGSQDGTITPSRYLPVGQGFIVEIVANGTVEFNNSQRVFIKESDADGSYDTGSSFLKSSNVKSKGVQSKGSTPENDMQRIRLEFKSVTGPATRRELLLGFSENATDGFDYGYDALCTESNNNDFNLNFEGKNMNIQAYSPIEAEKVIPLNFKSSGSNSFEIKISETENLEADQAVYLRDNVTGEYFDLSSNTAYRFSATAGKFNKRFEIVFQNEQQSLSAEESTYTENFIYFQNTNNTLFAKKLNASVSKLAIINMNGQTVMELNNVSTEALNNGIKISNVATGAYVACFRTDDNQVHTKKIIVN